MGDRGTVVAAKRTCPACGAHVNIENLKAHLAKVHPRESLRLEVEEPEAHAARRAQAPLSRGTRRGIAAVGIGVAAVLVAAALGGLLLRPAGGTIHFDPWSYDFGDIGQSVVSTTFRLHNQGTSPLRIDGASTSCMCTTARITYGGQVSPTYGFHANPGGWSLVLSPGAEALLEVFYDPQAHPELGSFAREVYVLSSDANLREATVGIRGMEV